jgi:hypothetical protein
MLSIKKVVLESFAIDASSTGRRAVIRLSGTGDMVAVEPLKACLEQVRGDVTRLNFEGIEIDIRALYLLNSSCIKALVHFIYLLQTDGPRFSIKFSVDHNLSWQARALSPLVRMAPDIVHVVS